MPTKIIFPTDKVSTPFLNNELPSKEGLPSKRTTGIAIAKNGMAAKIQQKFVKMNTLKPAHVAAGMAPAGLTGNNATFILPNEILYADDLNLGYRMDMQPMKTVAANGSACIKEIISIHSSIAGNNYIIFLICRLMKVICR